jgi:D-alanyl-D-alanine carboxypeptidase
MTINSKWIKKKILGASAVLLSLTLAGAPLCAAAKVEDDAIYTEDGIEDLQAELARNKAQAVQTNLDPDWPHGPAIGAAGAVVMDAQSGAVLYGKNMNKHLYPASITKIMTALLAYENLDPDDTVTFSENAVFGIESGSSNIGMDVGESITVAEALYGLMVASANEVAIALGERVSGTEPEFVKLMNRRAAELGCKDTNFVTTNGLHDSNHYTSAYDMALIAREIYKHPDLVEYMSQMNYHFEASANQPDDFWILNTNDFLTGEIPCDDIVGGKTGYTDQARETLVSFAERDGKKLVCVIMREEPPYQFYDTIDLLDYAFNNFKKINVAQEEKRFTQKSADFLSSGPDIFGNSTPSFYISEENSLMIPNSLSFSDLSAEIIPAVSRADGTQEKNGTDTGSEGGTETTDPSSTQAAAAEAPDQAGESSTAGERAADTDAESSPGQVLPASAPENSENRVIGTVKYKFHDYDLGSVDVLFRNNYAARAEAEPEASSTGATTASADLNESENRTGPETVHGIRSLVFGLVHTGAHGSIYLNILLLIPLLLAVTFLLCILIFVYDYFAQRSSRHRKKLRRAQRAQRQNATRYSETSGPSESAQSSGYSGSSKTARSSGYSGSSKTARSSGYSGSSKAAGSSRYSGSSKASAPSGSTRRRTGNTGERRNYPENRDYTGRGDYEERPVRRSSGKRTPRDRSSR